VFSNNNQQQLHAPGPREIFGFCYLISLSNQPLILAWPAVTRHLNAGVPARPHLLIGNRSSLINDQLKLPPGVEVRRRSDAVAVTALCERQYNVSSTVDSLNDGYAPFANH
jgi:hypothetical protein